MLVDTLNKLLYDLREFQGDVGIAESEAMIDSPEEEYLRLTMLYLRVAETQLDKALSLVNTLTH